MSVQDTEGNSCGVQEEGKKYIFFSIDFSLLLSPVSEIAFPRLQKHWLWPAELLKFTENTVSALT
jgi:hypothetical protein